MLLTFQIVTELVPPWMASWNTWEVTTFTETVAGEMVTLMLVTGSVQVEVELVEDVVEAVVVQVIAVLAAEWWHDGKVSRAVNSANKTRRFTAPLSLLLRIPKAYDSVSNLVLKM